MRKYLLIGICCTVATFLAIPAIYLTSCHHGDTVYLYIREYDTPETVRNAMTNAGVRPTGFSLLTHLINFKMRSGRYAVHSGDNMLTLFRHLRNGQQEPLNLTIPSVRTMDRLAAYLGERLMLDSVEVAMAFADSLFCRQYGYTPQTLPALFIPNTYQIYWDTSLNNFMVRMQRENKAFWTEERNRKARKMGMTHEEVMTLASIIDEETANNEEKPMIAGMYVKRLSIGMPLQADPTVKFALGDFSLKRIWGKHLQVDSPYNTYKSQGLPPGPIRIPSVAGIDAVLNHVPHDYVYMCAKEDFSGTHNFARTYVEHLKNARRYTQALNERNIQ